MCENNMKKKTSTRKFKVTKYYLHVTNTFMLKQIYYNVNIKLHSMCRRHTLYVSRNNLIKASYL